MKKLVLLIGLAMLLASCQTSTPLTIASVVPTHTAIPPTTTNTPKPTSTPAPPTPTSELIATLSEFSVESFIEYDSTEYINENGLSDRIPVFSVKYPPEWKYRWYGDGDQGGIALVISSVELYDAFTLQYTSGNSIYIIPMPYNGEKPTDLFFGYERSDKIIEEPMAITINGQDATRVKFVNNEQIQTEILIVEGKWALNAMYTFPTDKEAEFLRFQLLVETIISTIAIK